MYMELLLSYLLYWGILAVLTIYLLIKYRRARHES